MKSQRKTIVEFFRKAGTYSLLKSKWITPYQWESHINDDLPLVVDADFPPLAGGDIPLYCGIRINFNNQHILINGNNLHCAIIYDPVLMLHDRYGKHNAEDTSQIMN